MSDKPSATPALDALIDWVKKQPKCLHDGKGNPCFLCVLMDEARRKRKDGVVP